MEERLTEKELRETYLETKRDNISNEKFNIFVGCTFFMLTGVFLLFSLIRGYTFDADLGWKIFYLIFTLGLVIVPPFVIAFKRRQIKKLKKEIEVNK